MTLCPSHSDDAQLSFLDGVNLDPLVKVLGEFPITQGFFPSSLANHKQHEGRQILRPSRYPLHPDFLPDLVSIEHSYALFTMMVAKE